MEFKEVVKNRYSCKKYDGQPVSKEALDAILEAGRLAPTARNKRYMLFNHQRVWLKLMLLHHVVTMLQ